MRNDLDICLVMPTENNSPFAIVCTLLKTLTPAKVYFHDCCSLLLLGQ